MSVKSINRCAIHRVLILLFVMFAGQTIATVHAVEHGFHNDGDICFVCDAADNFQNSLHADSLPEYHEFWRHTGESAVTDHVDCSRHYAYLTRAPPGSNDL